MITFPLTTIQWETFSKREEFNTAACVVQGKLLEYSLRSSEVLLGVTFPSIVENDLSLGQENLDDSKAE